MSARNTFLAKIALVAVALASPMSHAQQPAHAQQLAHVEQPAPSLQAVLSKLDAASAHFTSAQAAFHKDLYNALVRDTTPQDGVIYFQRTKNGSQMGARIDGAGARTVEYKNGILRDYNPGIKCFDTVAASGNKARIDSFLTLGFGGSGKDLEKAWVIQNLGTDTLQDNGHAVKVERLDLVPREQSVKSMVTHVTLWLDVDRGVSLKQVFYSPSGDTQTAVYSHVRLNERIDTKPFEIKGGLCGK